MVSTGIAKAGYQYVNIDEGWWLGERDAEGNSWLIPSLAGSGSWRHAGDMGNIVRFIHGLGLKAGIYTDAGKDGCSLYPDLGPVYQHVGSEGHYEQDFLQFANWGFDYVKVDWCGGDKEKLDPAVQYGEIARAIAKAEAATGRRLYFSLCEWGNNVPLVHCGAPQCTDISALVAVRFLTGAGLGAAMPVVIAMTSDHSPAEQKKRYVGIVYCAIAFGGMLAAGVVATGILGNGWSQVFYVGGVVPILISIAMIFFLPVSKRVVAAPGAPEGSYWIDVLGWRKLPLTLSLWFATFLTLAVMYTMVMWMPSLMGARGISRADGAIIQMMYNLGRS